MNRWVVAPVVAFLVLCGSGFLDALERTTEQSALLARASEEAPKTTREAAAEVEDIPLMAELTERQADAFKALADALELSGQRVEKLNGSLEEQLEGLDRLHSGLGEATDPLRCIIGRLVELAHATAPTAQEIDHISATLHDVVAAQDKAIRHLKSINRKLTALGVVATATDVKAPPPPPDAPAPDPGGSPAPIEC